MQTLNLPLFSTLEPSTNTQNNITNETVIEQPSPDLFDPLKKAFKEIFPQNMEEATITRMRKILGEKAKEMSDDQVQCIATEFQFLIDNWLDEFEKNVFNGMTLKEVLNET